RTPIIAMISRLTAQKGFALVDAIFPELMSRDLQFVLLGNGEAKYEDLFRAAAQQHPDRVAVRIGFDETLAHQIEAGADIFLMPSLYEPCGLNQLFSLKYGTPPIVHEVGGLRDSVQDYDAESGTGTGFVFTAPAPLALLDAVDRSLSIYGDNKNWTALRRRAMAMDFSWDRSAQSYSHLYQQLIG
ncbi:MAG TPA: glycosyltransferase, partial [Candidatus Binatia bacterium]